jgi:hypothetical protein
MDKFNTLYADIYEQIQLLKKNELSIEKAKAFAQMAKQANNVLSLQVECAKFIANVPDSKKSLEDVGL